MRPDTCPIRATPGFCVLMAALLLADDGNGLLLWFLLAAACHELGHLAAALAQGLEVRSLTLSAMGAELDISRRCSYPGELLLLLCGPLVNLLLAALCCRLPGGAAHLFAGINLLLALFNLLPIPPLDGGEMVCLGAEWLLPGRTAFFVVELLADFTCILFTAFGLWFALQGNPMLLMLGIWLLLGRLGRGISS